MSLNFYLILIVILLIFVFTTGILLVICRKFIASHCCGDHGEVDHRSPRTLAGRRNQAFDGNECLQIQQAPFNPMDPAESPPTYEEAVKQELFRYEPHTDLQGASLENAPSQISNSQHLRSSSSEDLAVPSTSRLLPTPSDQPTDLSSCMTLSIRPRASTSSSGVTTQLSTINEEDDEQWPLQVVIDSLGIQAKRLFDSNQSTTVNFENGSDLTTHSKC